MPKFEYTATRIENNSNELPIKFEVDAIDDDDAKKKGNILLNEKIKYSTLSLDDFVYSSQKKYKNG